MSALGFDFLKSCLRLPFFPLSLPPSFSHPRAVPPHPSVTEPFHLEHPLSETPSLPPCILTSFRLCSDVFCSKMPFLVTSSKDHTSQHLSYFFCPCSFCSWRSSPPGFVCLLWFISLLGCEQSLHLVCCINQRLVDSSYPMRTTDEEMNSKGPGKVWLFPYSWSSGLPFKVSHNFTGRRVYSKAFLGARDCCTAYGGTAPRGWPVHTAGYTWVCAMSTPQQVLTGARWGHGAERMHISLGTWEMPPTLRSWVRGWLCASKELYLFVLQIK